MRLYKKMNMSIQQLIVEAVSLLLLLGFIITFFIIFADKGETIVYTRGFETVSIKKSAILVLPIVCIIVYAVITVLQFTPKLWKTTKEEDAVFQSEKLLECVKLMISYTKIIFIGIFFYLAMMSIEGKYISNWFLPLAIFLAVAEIAFFMVRFFIISKKTLKDKETETKEIK